MATKIIYEVYNKEGDLIVVGDVDAVCKVLKISIDKFHHLSSDNIHGKECDYVIKKIKKERNYLLYKKKPLVDISGCNPDDCFNCPYPDCICPACRIKPVHLSKYINMTDGKKSDSRELPILHQRSIEK